MIPYCTKFGILKLNTQLINIHAYNVSRKPYKGMMLQDDASVEGNGKWHPGEVHRQHQLSVQYLLIQL